MSCSTDSFCKESQIDLARMRFYSWKMLLYISSLTATDEWYLPFESPDAIGGTPWQSLWTSLKNDLNSRFPFDGQTTVLDDYLEFAWKTRQGAALYWEGTSRLDPFLHLAEDYLIPSEANVRITWLDKLNVLKWGKSTRLLLQIPLGNMGQAPQISKSGIHGSSLWAWVKDRFDNQVLRRWELLEMYWQGHGSRVLAFYLLTACNGMEFSDKAWSFASETKLADVRDYASTNQWLMMNGCDHWAAHEKRTKTRCA